MGEAKRRKEALRQRMLAEGEKWDFEPSQWEEAVCVELRGEIPKLVLRIPADRLAWMRMPAGKCHENARWYAKNDQSNKARAVAGWWVQWPDFVLHSVVEVDGRLLCVTPTPDHEIEFLFISDPKITWIKDGKVYSPIRDGRVIGPGLRAFPRFTMARNAIVRERLLAGVDPFSAIEFSDEEMEELKREHIK